MAPVLAGLELGLLEGVLNAKGLGTACLWCADHRAAWAGCSDGGNSTASGASTTESSSQTSTSSSGSGGGGPAACDGDQPDGTCTSDEPCECQDCAEDAECLCDGVPSCTYPKDACVCAECDSAFACGGPACVGDGTCDWLD